MLKLGSNGKDTGKSANPKELSKLKMNKMKLKKKVKLKYF
eukprot:CAMPEP_0168350080 /NCGR_PEP_ID=MMETSP0213-20121227/20875_1 /TAXON_ID=151035 /ORGANISM="Euplotes harpa, Strain FSP1.4" /LENGTH=39 /DNA_ID= /DNA_START= /DNA_END= /DNA_ORIENTATION=